MVADLLKSQPEIALFASLALGYLIGTVRIGPIALGGVCGTLIVSLVLGQTGARLAPDLKSIAFALFIFALGFTGGPQFFTNIGRGWRYSMLSIVEVLSALALVLGAVVLLRLDVGTAAGLLPGAATESAVIGTASEAIAKLRLAAPDVTRLQADIVTAYSVSYLFGLVTIVLFTSQLAPLLLRIDLRAEALRAWRKLGGDGSLDDEQRAAVPALVGRAFRVGPAAGTTVAALEARHGGNMTVAQVLRGSEKLPAHPELALAESDIALVTGRREAIVSAAPGIGDEIAGDEFEALFAQSVDVLLTRLEVDGLTLREVREYASPEEGRGVYVSAVTRMDATIPARPGTELHRGDVLTLVGAPADVKRGAQALGYVVRATEKTDFVYLGLGVIVGMAIGRLCIRVGGVSIALGTGGGCLLAGLLFGWLRSRFPLVGSLPSAAAQILKDFGLATFIAAVGLSTGPDAIRPVHEYGLALPLAGIVLVLVPGRLSLWIGRTFLRLDAADAARCDCRAAVQHAGDQRACRRNRQFGAGDRLHDYLRTV